MKRWIILGSLIVAVTLVGCSKDEPKASTPTTSVSASSRDGDSPTSTRDGGTTTATLSLSDCLDVSKANLGLLSGAEEDAAKIKSFDPPDEVKGAVDVLVANGGISVDGSNQDDAVAAADTVANWVSDACPDS